jgi:hypothetical protein
VRLKQRHVIGVAIFSCAAFIAASRFTHDSVILLAVGLSSLCCLQIAMGLHVASLRNQK